MSSATLPPPSGSDSQSEDNGSEPLCEKCGVPNTAAACPACGWYPVLGIHVEIDSAYESCLQPAGAEQEVKQDDWQKHLEVWQKMIPVWAWLMIATCGGIVALGVAARLGTAGNPSLRSTIGVIGVLGGMFTLLVTHVVSFVLVSSDDADLGVADLIIKPTKHWVGILKALPEKFWLVNTGAGSLATALTAALIVGGIPYERLLDWGFKAPPKQNLVGAIAEQASKMKGDEKGSLEDSVNSFASQAGDLEGDSAVKELPRTRLDCLVIGYRMDDKERIVQLLLAATTRSNSLKYIGEVRLRVPPEENEAIAKKFSRVPAGQPFVKTNASGVWIQPRYTCRVTYTKWEEPKRPKNLRFEEMLGEVKTPW